MQEGTNTGASVHTDTHMPAQSASGSVVAHLHILMTAAVRFETASRQDKHPEAEGKRRVCLSECVSARVCVCAAFLPFQISVALKLILWLKEILKKYPPKLKAMDKT